MTVATEHEFVVILISYWAAKALHEIVVRTFRILPL